MSRLIAAVPGATFADGSVADVELWWSTTPVPDDTVFAAMAVVTDAVGRYAVAWSPRRQEWGIPGGWREVGESVVECVVREVWEETGLRLDPGRLQACGHEDLAPRTVGVWPPEGGSMQLFRITIPEVGPDLVAAEPDAVDPTWVSAHEFEALSGGQFWWPLVAAAMAAEQ
ncbi:NUDIX domain-containing protein [Pedococcus dokdonensis]|uniref:NUDIX domain-containing protein n=1 Tax=Pedococcus dokdonensis TaxID=443156 RepID=A0A1H0SMU3_9MICO|nr:NUDIX hydrolase [Pedococcus dokdonensis]SDP43064.1 NUDIX domain-containing protein [Pedococcus dokdonensis]